MKKGLKQPKKKQYRFNLSENLLTDAQWEYLSYGDTRTLYEKGWGITDYQKTFYKKLGQAIVGLHWILKKTHNLRKKDMDEIFNPVTLESIFQKILSESSHGRIDYVNTFKYDLKTSEIARLMFKLSTEYLLFYYLHNKNAYTIENVKRISEDFKNLSSSFLENASKLKTMNKQEREKFDEKSFKLFNESVICHDTLSKPYCDMETKTAKEMINEKHQELIMEVSRLQILLDNYHRDDPYNKSQMHEQLNIKIKELKENESNMSILKNIEGHDKECKKFESSVYDHIDHFFCRIDPIERELR